jgi:hypothetical protein
MKLPKFDLKNLIIIGLCVLLILLGFQYLKNQNNHKDEILQEQKLRNALNDTVKIYQNKEKEWVAEKLTIQAETKDLKDKNLILSENQKELVKRVDAISKHNQVITAALIDMGVKLDGLVNNKPTFENDSTLAFSSPKTDTALTYQIKVRNVKQFGSLKPSLEFTEFSLPNKQFVEFHWKNDKKEGYPISFTVTNTNPYYKVYDLDSYAIPELQKENVKPNFWNKLGNFSKTWGGRAIFLGAGVLIGASIIK